MSAEWICDGCGKRLRGTPTQHSGWGKPYDWFSQNLWVKEDGTEAEGVFGPRGPEEGKFKTILDACSRECIDRIASKTGTHRVVMPI